MHLRFLVRVGTALTTLLVATFSLVPGCSNDRIPVGGPDGGSDVGGGGTNGEAGGPGTGGHGSLCLDAGEGCEVGSECCTGTCDPVSKRCASSLQACDNEGESCTSSLDCCSLSCVGGACAASCVADAGECSEDAECCGGSCVDGACVALNVSCKTSGNACEDASDCCSSFCDEGTCAIGASYCVQKGDVCRSGTDCCTGTCAMAEGATLGTCGDPPPGPSNCSAGVAGTVCGDCNECCSRLCAPFGPSGLSICQPAGGCRLTGELCRSDLDCCGGDPDSDLPGAGNVSCEKEEGAELGVCRNAMSCSPQGNVCHFKDYTCSVSSAANKCCSGVGNSGECQLDDLGVPRCNGLGDECRVEGDTCSSSTDCCDDRPCVADENGQLRCIDPPDGCVATDGACTVNADCCSGATCVQGVGSTEGTCRPKDTPDDDCAEYGQSCEETADCCGGTPCNGGRCVVLVR